jgi:hypothetical protein
MSKKVSACSQSAWQSSASWGEDSELSNLAPGRNSVEHLDNAIDDRLIYVHVSLDFYYKCTANQALHGELTKAEGTQMMLTVDGDN